MGLNGGLRGCLDASLVRANALPYEVRGAGGGGAGGIQGDAIGSVLLNTTGDIGSTLLDAGDADDRFDTDIRDCSWVVGVWIQQDVSL